MRKFSWMVLLLPLILHAAPGESLLPAADKSQPAFRRQFGQVPPPETWDQDTLDRFFADAREKLGPGQPGGRAAGQSPAATVPREADEPAAAQGGFAWSRLIDAATIEDEIKSYVASTAEVTKNPSTFKGGGNKAARIDFSVIALLFGVIADYDGQVRWKRDAAGLRALYARAAANCKTGTDNSYKEARLRSENLAELIQGSKVDAPTTDAEVTWAEVVNRPPLMARMGPEGYSQKLKAWTADAGEFAKNRDGVLKESQVLALIAQVIQDAGYEFGDDETYLEYARELQQHALEVVEAAKGDNFQRAQQAVGQLNQACNTCHEGYRS